MIKALIVDDERLARSELSRLLADVPQVEVVGEARNAAEASIQIGKLQPDLLFLDIQMPGGDGFQLLEQLEIAPLVIFTTAYDQYALKAFEVSALDYLVKPIVPERLAAAIQKVLSRPMQTNSSDTVASSATRVIGSNHRVFVRDGERCWFVTLDEIALFESQGNYTRLIFGPDKPLLLRSLNYLQGRLDPALFFRANRGQIINLKFIEAIHPWPNGGYRIRLRGGWEVTMSRRQGQRFQELTNL